MIIIAFLSYIFASGFLKLIFKDGKDVIFLKGETIHKLSSYLQSLNLEMYNHYEIKEIEAKHFEIVRSIISREEVQDDEIDIEDISECFRVIDFLNIRKGFKERHYHQLIEVLLSSQGTKSDVYEDLKETLDSEDLKKLLDCSKINYNTALQFINEKALLKDKSLEITTPDEVFSEPGKIFILCEIMAEKFEKMHWTDVKFLDLVLRFNNIDKIMVLEKKFTRDLLKKLAFIAKDNTIIYKTTSKIEFSDTLIDCKGLKLIGPEIAENSLECINKIKSLKFLELQSTGTSWKNLIFSYPEFKRLKELKMINVQFYGSLTDEIQNFEELTTLQLNVKVDRFHDNFFKSMDNLTDVKLIQVLLHDNTPFDKSDMTICKNEAFIKLVKNLLKNEKGEPKKFSLIFTTLNNKNITREPLKIDLDFIKDLLNLDNTMAWEKFRNSRLPEIEQSPMNIDYMDFDSDEFLSQAGISHVKPKIHDSQSFKLKFEFNDKYQLLIYGLTN